MNQEEVVPEDQISNGATVVKRKLVVTVTKQKCRIEPGAVPSRIA